MDTLNVCEMFHSIQGEGHDIGRNVMFLRLAKCNLDCSFCDSAYHKKESKSYNINEVINEYKKYKTNGLIITGGEPLLQQEAILNLVNTLDINYVAIETNGTILPNIKFVDYDVRFNVSPKLGNSGNSTFNRFKPEVLGYIKSHCSFIFKFVIKDFFDLTEVKAIVDKCGIHQDKVYLMTEGKTKAEQEANQLNIIELCLKEGYNFSPRLHINIWDSKRGV